MKKLLIGAFALLFAVFANAQTFPVQNLQVLGNSTFAGTAAFSGVTTAPTPTAGDNSTNVATTAFITTALGGSLPAVTSNAALIATPSTAFARILRVGFYAQGDVPPLLFISSNAPCSLNAGAGDGGTQVPSSDGKCWLASPQGTYANVRQWGAKCDGSTNDTAAMQAAHNTGKLIYYPAGNCLFTTLTMSSGGIIGDGYFSSLTSTDATSADIITYTGVTNPTQIPTFQNFAMFAQNTKAAGAAIHLSPSGGTPLSYVHINNIYVYNFPRGVQFTNCEYGSIMQSTIVNYSDSGIFFEFPLNTGAGDFAIDANHITTAVSSGNRIGIQQVSGGGLRISNNKILGGQSGYVLAYNGTIASGPMLITNNSIENIVNFGLFFGTTNTGTFGNIVISGNEINMNSGVGTGANGIGTDTNGKISIMTITGNTIGLAQASGQNCITLNAVGSINITGNVLTGDGNPNTGITIAANNNTTGRISSNTFTSLTTTVNNGSANVSVTP